LKFQREVWAGWACAGANQQELTTCTKSGGQEEKKIQKKWELPHKSRRRSVAGGRPLVAGRRSTPALVGQFTFFEIFLFKKKEFLEVWEMGQGFWENGCTTPPFFEALGSANSSKIHGEWRFTFSHNLFLLNLVHTWTFISTIGIFVS
jgi:hypothetical protein